MAPHPITGLWSRRAIPCGPHPADMPLFAWAGAAMQPARDRVRVPCPTRPTRPTRGRFATRPTRVIKFRVSGGVSGNHLISKEKTGVTTVTRENASRVTCVRAYACARDARVVCACARVRLRPCDRGCDFLCVTVVTKVFPFRNRKLSDTQPDTFSSANRVTMPKVNQFQRLTRHAVKKGGF